MRVYLSHNYDNIALDEMSTVVVNSGLIDSQVETNDTVQQAQGHIVKLTGSVIMFSTFGN